MKDISLKEMFIILGSVLILSFVLWFGFYHLWQLYPDKDIFRNLTHFSPPIAYILVSLPYLIIEHKKSKQNK